MLEKKNLFQYYWLLLTISPFLFKFLIGTFFFLILISYLIKTLATCVFFAYSFINIFIGSSSEYHFKYRERKCEIIHNSQSICSPYYTCTWLSQEQMYRTVERQTHAKAHLLIHSIIPAHVSQPNNQSIMKMVMNSTRIQNHLSLYIGNYSSFLSLLCATAQQSYYHGIVICCLSVVHP